MKHNRKREASYLHLDELTKEYEECSLIAMGIDRMDCGLLEQDP
jgi:hypothetical protein